MKKALIIWGVFSVCVLVMPGCGEDELPKSTLDFEETEMEIFESDPALGLEGFRPDIINGGVGREVVVTIEFNRPMAEKSVVAYTLAGTADLNTTTVDGDYEIAGNGENFVIEKGETTADIVLTLFEDRDLEIDEDGNLFETIEIQLTEVISGSAKIGENSTITINVFEDDAVVVLDWDIDGGAGDHSRGDVDMDMFLSSEGDYLLLAASIGSDDPEFLYIPGGFPVGSYGLSYTYYSGTSDNLQVYAQLLNFGGTLNGNTYIDDALLFEETYSLANINAWDEDGAADPAVVQTMTKSGFNYLGISEISVPVSGSRLDNQLKLKEFQKTLTDSKRKQLLKIIRNLRSR